MKGKARVRNLMVECRRYETTVTCYRRPEYPAPQKIRTSIAKTKFILVEGIAA